MIIYVDENISPYLSRGFNILQTPENIKISDPIEVRSIVSIRRTTGLLQSDPWLSWNV